MKHAPPQHIIPDELSWEVFNDPHGRPTTPTRVLKTNDPFLIEADFPAYFFAGLHWHPYDTIYLITRGEMRIGDEGSFRPGDIRWVKAGHVYGPEEAGEEGVQFHLFSLGGDIGLNWADLYEVPEELKLRLSLFKQVVGRCQVDQIPLVTPGDILPDRKGMLDEAPLIFRVRMADRQIVSDFSIEFDTVWYLLSGSVLIAETGTIKSGEFFCAGANETHSLSTGSEGAFWLVFASSSNKSI